MRRYSTMVLGGLCLGAATPVLAQSSQHPGKNATAAPAIAAVTQLAPLTVEGLISQADIVKPPLAPSIVDTAAAMRNYL